MTSKEHFEAAQELSRTAKEYASEYTHKADRAVTVAITGLTQAVLSLHDPLERLAGATEKLAEWSENNWRLRD